MSGVDNLSSSSSFPGEACHLYVVPGAGALSEGKPVAATVPCVRLKALNVGRQVWGSAVFGRPETKRRLELPRSYTSLRVAPSLALRIHFWRLLQLCGDVELNPRPILRGAQWSVGGLTQPKRIPLEKWLKEERVAWSVLVETHFSAPVCGETPAHLLLCPGFEAIRTKHSIPSLEKPAVFFSRELAKMLCVLFQLGDPCPTSSARKSEAPPLEGDRSPSLLFSRLLVSHSPSRPRRLGAEKVKGRLLRKRSRSLEGHGTNVI